MGIASKEVVFLSAKRSSMPYNHSYTTSYYSLVLLLLMKTLRSANVQRETVSVDSGRVSRIRVLFDKAA